MKRIVVAVILVLVLMVALGTSALAEGPSDAAYDAPAKGHQGVPGKGKGHYKARGVGHVIHVPDNGDIPSEDPPILP